MKLRPQSLRPREGIQLRLPRAHKPLLADVVKIDAKPVNII